MWTLDQLRAWDEEGERNPAQMFSTVAGGEINGKLATSNESKY